MQLTELFTVHKTIVWVPNAAKHRCNICNETTCSVPAQKFFDILAVVTMNNGKNNYVNIPNAEYCHEK